MPLFIGDAFVHQDTNAHQDASVNPILAGDQVLGVKQIGMNQPNRNLQTK